jgi:hypothetical protein
MQPVADRYCLTRALHTITMNTLLAVAFADVVLVASVVLLVLIDGVRKHDQKERS